MTPSTSDGDRATAEQSVVVDRPADSRTLLVAPAGTGKTFTLVRRIEHLLDEGLVPDEVQLLSFSRAVVAELARRGRATGGRARFVPARTFDAWALALLEDLYPDQDWRRLDFEGRVEEAAGAIRDGDAVEHTRGIRHVLLDEIQDLVGSRQKLVEALLTSLDCGFTAVGDPAQAIFTFQARPGERDPDLFTWIRDTYPEDLTELSLTRDFRARTPRPPGLLACGAALRRRIPEDEGLPTLIRNEFLDLETAGGLDDIVGGFAYQEGTSAVLCRDNGQALEVSARLWRDGVDHRLRRRADDGANPRWLVDLFDRVGGVTVDRSQFDEATAPVTEFADEVWAELVAVTGTRSGRIATDRLRRALATGRLSRLPVAPGADKVTVSSMHGAKGLEYDRVFLLETRPRDGEDEMAEARVLYTAMTRSRDDLYRLDPLRVQGPFRTRFCRDANRWGRFKAGSRYGRLGIALDGEDVERHAPAGTVGFAADPVELQSYLRAAVRRGDPVTLSRLDEAVDDDLPVPLYAVEHAGRPIGVVSPSFRHALRRHVHGRRDPDGRWPRSITDGWIDDVETVAGSTATGTRAGLNEHGVWSAPRLSGLTWFRWKDDSADE